jgi:hypothetical protein
MPRTTARRIWRPALCFSSAASPRLGGQLCCVLAGRKVAGMEDDRLVLSIRTRPNTASEFLYCNLCQQVVKGVSEDSRLRDVPKLLTTHTQEKHPSARQEGNEAHIFWGNDAFRQKLMESTLS